METLIFALIASYNAHPQDERVIAEPEEFQSFDLQALRNSTVNKPSQSSIRLKAYLTQPSRLRVHADAIVTLAGFRVRQRIVAGGAGNIRYADGLGAVGAVRVGVLA